MYYSVSFMKFNMTCRTVRSSVIKKYGTILTYFILVCIAAPGSAKRFMSNLPKEVNLKERHISPLPELMKKCIVCGIAHERPTEIIVKGEEVHPPNKYPWMVRLQAKGKKCGGALLSRFHIITAAHCIPEGLKPNKMVVKFLTNDPKILKAGPPVEKISVHPKYKDGYQFDIALLKLKIPITCNNFTSPICLPSANMSFPKKSTFITSGWGRTSVKKKKRKCAKKSCKVLMESKLLLIKPDDCKLKNKYILCVTGLNGTTPCEGDSGGSMFMQEKNAFYTVGVTSRHTSGKRCDPKKPVEYVIVSKHMKWIKKETKLSEAHPVD